MSADKPFRRFRQTKIVATLGPASSSYEMVKKLFEEGADVFRMNFSHGTPEDHKARLDIIRRVEKEYGHAIGVFADLQGPKIRIGRFKDGSINLHDGQTFTLDRSDAPGDETRVELPHDDVFEAVSAGEMLLLDDGKVHLEIESVSDDKIVTKVISGKKLSDSKGVNLPNTLLKSSP